MFATPAFAQTAGAPTGGPQDLLLQFLPLIGLIVLFYFLMIRPQQKRMKQHQQMISNLKRGDQIVLNDGVIGKICLLYTSPSPRDRQKSRMPSSA